MKDKAVNSDLNFEEALTIIANTKKSTVDTQHKDIALKKDNVYNVSNGEAKKHPHPTKSRS